MTLPSRLAVDARGEEKPAAEAEEDRRPGRHPRVERVSEQKSGAEAEQDSRRHDRSAEVPERREREEDRADDEEDRARPGEVELAAKKKEEAETHQHDADVQAPPIRRAHRFFASSTARGAGPTAFSPSQR